MESDSTSFDAELKQQAAALINDLDTGDVDVAVDQLLRFNDIRTDGLYQQVGKITRGLHDAITNLEIKEDPANEGQRDVQARLSYVIELTSNAANRTMDLAEGALPVAGALREEATRLGAEWEKLGKRELTGDEFRALYSQMAEFLSYSARESQTLHEGFTEIVLAQGYQDLSGQIIQKIMAMLKRTEEDLLGLLALAGGVKNFNGESVVLSDEPVQAKKEKDLVAEGPLPDVASSLKNQDEVDDLLSSLGF